ncbi:MULTISPECIES: maleylacetoacetate isomerase [Nitrospirillum]|uniref:Maleylacetoacetate isomerase n=1 Tax=Nitrospirillum amazonense TaxID=28077 RepID=A0A560FBF2_9PROT|nr:maleylacetoacetate isomerase [Nitrospirillum amazonense]MEC4593233.1 maleylacetoacetate isomerase [Nitrospirillum amazonense]TWB18900.1 maleylacetoacetate isomerase [Nitrospirillum amazonense]
MASLTLYTYFRSSAAYRVRIALNLKGLTAEQVPVHLLRDGGEQLKPEYLALNPQGQLPTLAVDDATGCHLLTQSLAIAEYLDEVHPTPALLPADPIARAQARAVALAIACDIHPINNLRVQKYLKGEMGVDEERAGRWVRHWMETGLAAVEAMVKPHAGRFCFGDTPGLADLTLVPQMFNARRFNADLSACPTLVAIDQACLALPAFADAAPESQADAPPA